MNRLGGKLLRVRLVMLLMVLVKERVLWVLRESLCLSAVQVRCRDTRLRIFQSLPGGVQGLK